MRLSEHFDSSEFACKCGCGGLNNGAGINPKLIRKLEEMRAILGRPLVLSCGYRCPKHNAEIPGSVSNSQHIYGTACDIVACYNDPVELYAAAEKVGFDAVGLYSWGIHVDVRGYYARW